MSDWQEWRPVVGYEGRYEVSDRGNVRRASGPALSGGLSSKGYRVVTLRAGPGNRRFVSIHRLVAQAFIPNPNSKPAINHIDHDRANNRVDNLEWCTQAENLAHMDAHGRRSTALRGRRSLRAKLTDVQAQAIRDSVAAGMSWGSAAQHHGASKRTVGRIVLGQTYRPEVTV